MEVEGDDREGGRGGRGVDLYMIEWGCMIRRFDGPMIRCTWSDASNDLMVRGSDGPMVRWSDDPMVRG